MHTLHSSVPCGAGPCLAQAISKRPDLGVVRRIESGSSSGKLPFHRNPLDALQQNGSPGLAERPGVDMPRATPVKTESLQISFEMPPSVGKDDDDEDEWETVGEDPALISGSLQVGYCPSLGQLANYWRH